MFDFITRFLEKKDDKVEQAPAPVDDGPKIQIRWFIRRDMERVVAIERESFPEEIRWGEDNFLASMRQRNCIGMVVEYNSQVTGFMVYELNKGYLQLLNMAVHPDFRGLGLGREMALKLVDKLQQQHRNEVVVLLPESIADVRPFFEQWPQVRILLTDKKGTVGIRPVISDMMGTDIEEVQALEDQTHFSTTKDTPRDVAFVLLDSSNAGIVVRNQFDNGLLGYALFLRDGNTIRLRADIGIAIHPGCTGRGVGEKLMTHLAGMCERVHVTDIDPDNRHQIAFLRSLGVKVVIPEPVLLTSSWSLAQYLKNQEDRKLLSGFCNSLVAIFEQLPEGHAVTFEELSDMTPYKRILYLRKIAVLDVVEQALPGLREFLRTVNAEDFRLSVRSQ